MTLPKELLPKIQDMALAKYPVVPEKRATNGELCQMDTHKQEREQYIYDFLEALTNPELLSMAGYVKGGWISVTERTPNAYQSWLWDGLKSDPFLAIDKWGRNFIAISYKGTMDGHHFTDYYNEEDFPNRVNNPLATIAKRTR